MDDRPGREQAGANDGPGQGLQELALVAHPRIAGAHAAPELRVIPVERLLDLLQLALLIFREGMAPPKRKPCAEHMFGDVTSYTHFVFWGLETKVPGGQ